MLKDFAGEYARYRGIGEKALAQVSDEALNRLPGDGCNSIAVIVRHIGGNLVSRFTDFLTTDGDKPWRNRDGEFVERAYSRAEVHEVWNKGWGVLTAQLAQLTDADLQRAVTIRGQALTVHEALTRSVAHTGYHVGQIVVLARIVQGAAWQNLSIPRGQSQDYNRNPTLEKGPR